MSVAADNPCLLKPFLGWKRDKSGTLFWSVCGWCPQDEKRAVEQEAARLGVTVSHGICPACSARMISQVTGEAA